MIDVLILVVTVIGVPIALIAIAYLTPSRVVQSIPILVVTLFVIQAWHIGVNLTPFDIRRAWGDGWLPMVASHALVFGVLHWYTGLLAMPIVKQMRIKWLGADPRPVAKAPSNQRGFVTASTFPERQKTKRKRTRGQRLADQYKRPRPKRGAA